MAYDILVKVGADISDFSRKMSESNKALADFGKANQQTFDSFKKVGAVAVGAGTAIAGGLGFAVKRAANFESAMSSVAAISGATGKDFELLSEKAREMGSKTSFSAIEAAEGLEYMALAGWDTEQMLGGIEPVLHLAEAGALDLGRASDLVTDSMSALGVEVGDLGGYLDKVAKTSASANTDIDALMEALVIAGGKFRELNVPLEESNAMLGILANRGFKGSEAGTAMNAILTRLTATTGPSAKALEDLGISAFDSQGNFRGMEVVMKDVEKALSKMDDEQRSHYQTQIAGLNHGKAFSAMLDGLSNEYDELKDGIVNSNGALKEMRDIMKDNLQGALEELASAFDEIMISIGTALLPYVKQLGEWLQSLADWFNNLSNETKEKIAVFAALASIFLVVGGAALLLIGFIPNIISGFMSIITVVKLVGKGFMLLTNPVGIAVAIIIGAVFLIIKYWKPISEFFANLWEGVKKVSIKVWDSVVEAWNSAVEWLKNIWQGIVGFFSDLWSTVTEETAKAWQGIKDALSEAWDSVVGVFESGMEFLQGVVDKYWSAMKDGVFEVWEGIVTFFENFWELIKNIFIGSLLTILLLVTGRWDELRETTSQIWENIVESLQGIWDGIVQIFTGAFQIISGILSEFWETIRELFSSSYEWLNEKTGGAFGEMVELISSYFDTVKEIVIATWEFIKSTFGNALDFLKALVTLDFEGMKNAIDKQMEAAKKLISDIWAAIKNNVGAKLSEILSNVVKRFNEIKSNITSKITEAKNNLVSRFTEMVSNTISKASEIVTSVKDKFEEVKSAIRDKLTEAVNTLKEKIGEMPGAVTGFVGDMLSAGKDLVQGLIDGILAMGQKAIEAVTGVVDGVINKAKSLLKISSPSRLFKQFGKWTGEGLVDGMLDMRRAVESAADVLAESAIPDMRNVELSYQTPAGVRGTLASAVKGTVDVSSRDDRLISAIGSLERRLTNLEVVMDGEKVGRIVRPHVNEGNAIDDSLRYF